MQPDEIMALMTIVLLLSYGASQGYTKWLAWQRQTTNRMPIPPQQPPTARQPKTTRPRTYTRRSLEDRLNEQKLIQAALGAGLDPAWLAKTLRGHPGWNRRRIAGVARMVSNGS